MKAKFVPSPYFLSMCGILRDTMMFRRKDYSFAVFLWVVSPLLPIIILGWYLADITD